MHYYQTPVTECTNVDRHIHTLSVLSYLLIQNFLHMKKEMLTGKMMILIHNFFVISYQTVQQRLDCRYPINLSASIDFLYAL